MGILRLLLALSVVATHSSAIFGVGFVGGQLAVQAFYMISGFYMTLILNEKYVNENDSYKLFISNRLLKLFPIYWTVLILTLLLTIAGLLATHGAFEGKLRAYIDYHRDYGNMNIFGFVFLIFTNLMLLGQDLVMFLGLDPSTGNFFFTSDFYKTNPQLNSFLLIPQAWTLGIEITFYLIAPFIVRRKTVIIVLIIILSLLLRSFLISNGLENDPWSYRFFPCELAFFLIGTIAYRLYVFLKSAVIPKRVYLMILGVVLTQVLFYFFYSIPYQHIIYFVTFALSIPFVFLLTKSYKWDYALGELSYPIYISHMLVLYVAMDSRFPKIESLGTTVAFCTIIFAILLNKFIAKPVEKIRQSRLA